jgi:hypothetical protein
MAVPNDTISMLHSFLLLKILTNQNISTNNCHSVVAKIGCCISQAKVISFEFLVIQDIKETFLKQVSLIHSFSLLTLSLF